jgi:signal transduction histidine kinase
MTREIKTRLTPILPPSDLLADELDTEHGRSWPCPINRGTIRLDEKLNAMLDIARIEAGALPMEYSLIALPEIVAEAVKVINPVLSGYRQKLVTDIPPKLPKVQGDRKRLRQVILNFLEAAAKITPERK